MVYQSTFLVRQYQQIQIILFDSSPESVPRFGFPLERHSASCQYGVVREDEPPRMTVSDNSLWEEIRLFRAAMMVNSQS
jgi:hypothetical protein